ANHETERQSHSPLLLQKLGDSATRRLGGEISALPTSPRPAPVCAPPRGRVPPSRSTFRPLSKPHPRHPCLRHLCHPTTTPTPLHPPPPPHPVLGPSTPPPLSPNTPPPPSTGT